MLPQSSLCLVKRFSEFVPHSEIKRFARALRGIYVLYQYDNALDNFNVVYVGLAAPGRRGGKSGGIAGRLRRHLKKAGLWSHFSLVEVLDSVSDEEIAELEGLFRTIYRKDAHANKLNVQKGFRKFKAVTVEVVKR